MAVLSAARLPSLPVLRLDTVTPRATRSGFGRILTFDSKPKSFRYKRDTVKNKKWWDERETLSIYKGVIHGRAMKSAAAAQIVLSPITFCQRPPSPWAPPSSLPDAGAAGARPCPG